MTSIDRRDIAESLQTLGLAAGDNILVHSSLRSLGYVDGGADTVVDALLDVLGPMGTLVVPTFTPYHHRVARPVFDPLRDPSDVGRISETVRTRPNASRSTHLLHSVAALGYQAKEITVQHGPAAFAADGPFWKLYELDGRILLLGVPYLRSTYFHVVEHLVQPWYRYWREIDATIRNEDGTEQPLHTRVFGPRPDHVGTDLNKFGAYLETMGLVRVGAVGNAVARLFSTRQVVEQGIVAYRNDPLLFVRTGERVTPLSDGIVTSEHDNEKAVFDIDLMYSSNDD
jgi:aminoglycoside 3-N-acetyltransferase